jgi:hypothetical protein
MSSEASLELSQLTVLDDHRARHALDDVTIQRQLREETRQALDRANVAYDDDKLTAIVNALRSISSDGATIRHKVLNIGRRLLVLQQEAGDRGYKELYRTGLTPIEPSRASRYRQIALAIVQRRIDEGDLPVGFNAAYFAARLSHDTLHAMREAKVLNPNASVPALKRFVAAREPASSTNELSEAERSRLEKELRRLEARVARLRQTLGITPSQN